MYAMTKENQLKIKLEQTPADRILEGLAAAALIVLLILPALYYGELPESIPAHFNAAGEADGYGGKWTIFLLSFIGLAVYALLTFINSRPYILNFPVKITPENTERQYRLAARFNRILKIVITVMFLYLSWAVITGALSGRPSLGAGFIWMVMAGVFGTIGWYSWAAMKGR